MLKYPEHVIINELVIAILKRFMVRPAHVSRLCNPAAWTMDSWQSGAPTSVPFAIGTVTATGFWTWLLPNPITFRIGSSGRTANGEVAKV